MAIVADVGRYQRVCQSTDVRQPLVEDYVAFGNSATVEMCEAFVKGAIAPFIPGAGTFTPPSPAVMNDTQCGCSSLCVDMIKNFLEIEDKTDLCGQVLGVVTDKVKKTICPLPKGLISETVCKLTDKAVDGAASAVSAGGWTYLCNIITENLSEQGYFDLNKLGKLIAEEYSKIVQKVCDRTCGYMMCSSPNELCKLTDGGSKKILETVTVAACSVLAAGAAIAAGITAACCGKSSSAAGRLLLRGF
jgi:hypothetical protein